MSARRWSVFLAISIFAGLALRLVFTEDMEWKEDEYYNYAQTLFIGRTKPWPWAGMNSGVYLANPGMSIWVFVWLARVVALLGGGTDPLALQRGLGVVAVAGIALLIPFALRNTPASEHLQPEHLQDANARKYYDEREPWLWACALALVNPFLVYYQRKLWPEGFFPLFSMLFLASWWKRHRAPAAVAWGFLGAILGQIQMAGFFFAGGFFLWTLLYNSYSIPRRQPKWMAWFLGSCIGAVPLIPWLWHVKGHPPPGHVLSGGWGDIVQLKFWVFWVTDALGLHLGNPLGLYLGGSVWEQISDFARYPLIRGEPTYLCGLAHALALISGGWLVVRGLGREIAHVLRKQAITRWIFARKLTQASFAQSAALFGFGILLTITAVNIRRYYMTAAFPLEQLWLARLSLAHAGSPKQANRARRFLFALWVAQFFISTFFVFYIHSNGGSLKGDYGEAYHIIRERHHAQTGESWPDLKLPLE